MLGILIGIAAVILTVGLGEGAQEQVQRPDQLTREQPAHRLSGQHHLSTGVRGGFGSASTLTEADATALASKTVRPGHRAVAPVVSSSEEVTAGATLRLDDDVNGTTPPGWMSVTVPSPRDASSTTGRHHRRRGRGDRFRHRIRTFQRPGPGRADRDVDGVPLTVIGVLNSVGALSSTTGTTRTTR